MYPNRLTKKIDYFKKKHNSLIDTRALVNKLISLQL